MEWLKTLNGIIITGVILTVIVLIESLEFVPWAPYFLVYAILGIVIPLWLKTYSFGGFSETFRKNLKLFIVLLVLSIIILTVADFIHNTVAAMTGVAGDPMYDFFAALEALSEKAGIKFGISSLSAKLIYAVYIIIWAPIGEELFYRGYMYGEMKKKISKFWAAIISTAFFGIRHATHFFFLLPEYPLIPALYWAVHAAIFGFIMVYAYEKTDSLYIPMSIHFLTNILNAMIEV